MSSLFPVGGTSPRVSGESQDVPSVWMSSGVEVGLLRLTDFLSGRCACWEKREMLVFISFIHEVK